MHRQSGTWALVAVILVFAGFGALMWTTGLFDFAGTAANAKIVAAALTLVGALIGSLVSIVGIVLKHSLDRRNADLKDQTERRLEIEAKRNADLQTESENRLKLEAAIQAVGLLSTTSGAPAPMIQRTGALFALMGLGNYELATVLVGSMLVTNELNSNSAARLLNRALVAGEPSIQNEAVTILYQHADKFLTPNGGSDFPYSILEWDRKLSDYVREWGMLALGRLMVARPLLEWEQTQANTIIGALALAWTTTEPNDRIKNDIGAILRSILNAFPAVTGTLLHPKQTINIDKIRSEVASITAIISATKELVPKLDAWAPTESARPGAPQGGSGESQPNASPAAK